MHNSTRWNTTHGSDCELKLKCFLLAKFIKVVCPCIHISFIVNESEKEHKSIEQKEKKKYMAKRMPYNKYDFKHFFSYVNALRWKEHNFPLFLLFCVVCRKTYKNKLCYKFICTKKKYICENMKMGKFSSQMWRIRWKRNACAEVKNVYRKILYNNTSLRQTVCDCQSLYLKISNSKLN